MIVAVLLLAFAASALLTGLVRRYALARAVLDIPNERSLHTVPTPRGGGLAIVVVVGLVHAACVVGGLLPLASGSAWGGAALLLAALGWADDRRPLPARTRLFIQVALAFVALAVITGASPAGALWQAVAVVFGGVAFVWFVNLYNFMDGADGLAAIQATVAAGALGMLAAIDGDTGVAAVALALAGASAGFLRWNRAPARIFLGDVGSYFLGGYLGLLACHLLAGGDAVWHWLILLAPFITDASLTLVRRILAGERWWAAHRTHAYQQLVTAGWSHKKLARAFLALCLLLMLLALAAFRRPALAPWLALLAYGLTGTIWAMILRQRRPLPST
jgi:Fuc2NAc and GlcNAc transferase